jgi:2',3'-cyclic-nucleotide 2'-phosphodiesterase/3'-nucleotidase
MDVMDPNAKNPMALAMNAIQYTSSTVGNHEFNYGPAVLNKFKSEAKFPLLSANVTGCRDYTFQPYTIKDLNGVQVGTRLTLTVPHWNGRNSVGCLFGDT